MKIFRLFLLVVATALVVINLWAVRYSDFWTKENIWPCFRVGAAVLLIVLIVRLIRRTMVKRS